MTTNPTEPSRAALRALAWLQGAAIVALAVLLLRGSDVAPAPALVAPPDAPPPATAPAAPPAPTSATPSVADTTSSSPSDRPSPLASASAAGTVLYGRVTDEAGEAIQNGIVWWLRADDGKQVATVQLSPRDPGFALPGLTAGTLTYRTRVTGFQESTGTVEIPADRSHLRHDLVLAKTWLLAVKLLTPDGKPLPDALLEASKQRPNLFHVEACAVVTTTRPEADFPPTALREVDFGLGRWRSARGFEAVTVGGAKATKDVAGTIEIDQRQPLWVSAVLRHRVLASALVEPGQPEVALTIPLEQVLKDLGTIRGRVVEATTGRPVLGAFVEFSDLQSGGRGDNVDDQGRFEVRDLRPGLLDVGIRGEAAHAPRDLVLLEPGQELDLGDVPVFAARTVKGRCEGLIGKAQDLRIAYTRLDPPSHPSMQRHTDSASIAADGSFTLHLPEGRYRLRASGAGGVVTDLDTRTQGEQLLVLSLAKEAPLRLDVQTGGEPWAMAVFDAEGRELWRRDLRSGWKFALPFLPGDYRIELRDRHGKVQTRQLHLGESGTDLRVP